MTSAVMPADSTGLWRTARALNARYTTPTRRRHAGRCPSPTWRKARSGARLLALLAGCRERVGFVDLDGARPVHADAYPTARDRHHAERLWRLAAGIAATPSQPAGDSAHALPGRSRRARGRRAARHRDRAAGRRVLVALAPGSASGAQALAVLSRARRRPLAARHGRRGWRPDDRALAAEIAPRLAPPARRSLMRPAA